MIILQILTFISFWPVWLFSHNVSTDYPYIYNSLLKEGFNLPYAWITRTATGFGENSIFILWSWPVDFLYGLLGQLNLSFDLAQILLGFVPFILISTYSIKKLLSYYNLSHKAVFAGSLFYIFNTYAILLLDGGQIMIALSYSLLPFVFLQLIKATEKFNFYNSLKVGVLLSVFGYLDIRFIYILFLLLSIKFLHGFITNISFNFFVRWLLVFGLSSVVFLSFHFYWIWPAINGGLSIPSTIVSSTNIDFLSFARFKHAILMLQPHWHLNEFGNLAATRKEFILIPILAFLSIFINKNRKVIIYWLIISALGIMLVKGSNPPLSGLYSYFYEVIPGFSIFRDPTKFYFLIALGYSVLIGFSFDVISKRLPVLFGLYIFYVLFLVRPLYLGNMTGLFSQAESIYSYQNVANILADDKDFGRVLWIPNRPPLGYVDSNHPVIELQRISNLRPFAIGTLGTYETANFIREGEHIKQILDVSGIKYIAYSAPETKKSEPTNDEKEYYETFSGQLSQLDWANRIYKDEAVSLFSLTTNPEMFFVADNMINISDSDNIYSEFAPTSEFSLKNNVLVFHNNRPESSYFLSDNLGNDPDKNGWWKRDQSDYLWFRNFLQSKHKLENTNLSYGGGYAINEGGGEIVISRENLSDNNMYIRTLSNSLGGEISLYQSDKLIATIDTLDTSSNKVTKKITGYGQIPDKYFDFEDTKFNWSEITIDRDQDLKIIASGELNVINAIVFGKLNQEIQQNLIKGESNVNVSYNFISPVEYEIEVENLDHESILVFAQGFDSHWKLNGQSPIEVYDLFNGFKITQNGQYNLYYETQNYLNQGLIVSGIGSSVILLYIMNHEFRKYKKTS